MTKSFTVLAILKLRDQGKLSLEVPVSKRSATGSSRPIAGLLGAEVTTRSYRSMCPQFLK
jgi:CubicO group peptidase (beta-lactamase class C family)